jgi:hypothetical protein
MRKLLAILLLVIVFTLSGCSVEKEEWENFSDFERTKYCQNSTHQSEQRCIDWNKMEILPYYTKEEVDTIIEELREKAMGGDILLAQALEELKSEFYEFYSCPIEDDTNE